MKNPRCMLVGIDFDPENGRLTEGSRAAVRQSLWLAPKMVTRVQFLHSYHVSDEDRHTPTAVEAEAARNEIARAMKDLGHDVSMIELIMAEGDPSEVIMRRVIEGDNDFVVVAKRNWSSAKFRKLGSVSFKLVRNCPCPVWVIRPDHHMTHRAVLAATDLSAVGDESTRWGALIANAAGCELDVVHAWKIPLALQMSASRLSEEEYEERTAEIVGAAREHIRSVPEVAALGDRIRLLIANDSPSHAVLSAIERVNPDLLVMGTISRTGIAGALVGNTAERLLHRLDCSLLAVKPRDFIKHF